MATVAQRAPLLEPDVSVTDAVSAGNGGAFMDCHRQLAGGQNSCREGFSLCFRNDGTHFLLLGELTFPQGKKVN